MAEERAAVLRGGCHVPLGHRHHGRRVAALDRVDDRRVLTCGQGSPMTRPSMVCSCEIGSRVSTRRAGRWARASSGSDAK